MKKVYVKWLKTKKKCVRIFSDVYGRKQYFNNYNIHQVRQHFKTRVRMMPFAGNYSNDKRFKKTDFLCQCLKSREEEKHLTSGLCAVYGDLVNENSDLNNDVELVKLFNNILARRDFLDKK